MTRGDHDAREHDLVEGLAVVRERHPKRLPDPVIRFNIYLHPMLRFNIYEYPMLRFSIYEYPILRFNIYVYYERLRSNIRI
jgi:hypothetical protein